MRPDAPQPPPLDDVHQPRERPVKCGSCRAMTWEFHGYCDRCGPSRCDRCAPAEADVLAVGA